MWEKEFSKDFAVPQEIAALVKFGKLIDVSWHNDVCPSFAPPNRDDLRLWSDHPDPNQRELGPDSKRFAITRGEDVFVTDCIESAISKIVEESHR